jgi:DNA-binding beta-propeller fold protein YncE
VYATSNYAAVATVTVGANPKGLCYSPDSKRLYVANSGGSTFTVISRLGSNYSASDTKTIGAGPWGIAVTP